MKRLAFTVAVLASTAPALAAEGLERTDASPNQNPDSKVAVEARFGPYRPNVDSELSTPAYANTFGDRTRYMVGLEVDWEAIHIPHAASLGFGGIVGFTRATGNAPFADGSPGSDEDTSLTLWNFAAVAALRIDVLARETWVPLVPYGKVGPAVSFWSSSNQSGVSRAPDGTLGRGRTQGMFYAVGGMLMLDFLDRQAAKTFSVEQGVHHTYAFFEYSIWDLRGLGQTNAMHVGDTTWTVGLAFEM